jgi:gliding motility-associated-like protein
VNVTVNPLPSLNLNLASHYCPYNAIIPLNPAPTGGTLSGPNVQGNTLNHSGVNPGTYQVTYNYTDGNGCSNSTSGNYQIPVPLVAAFSYETYCSDLFAENQTSPNTANHQYAWTLDGSNISIQQNLQFRYSQEGTFNLTLTATDNFNCVYSTTQEVQLTETLDLTGFFVANIITPNGDGINDELKLLPVFDDCLQYTLAIFNRWGQLVYEMTPESGAFKGKKSNGDDLLGGTYFYTLKTDRYDCDSPELKGWCNGQFVLKRD